MADKTISVTLYSKRNYDYTSGINYFNIRKGDGVSNFNNLPWKQISETNLKGWRTSHSADTGSLTADDNSYSDLTITGSSK